MNYKIRPPSYILIIIIFIAVLLYNPTINATETRVVSSVIDGDSIKIMAIQNPTTVRLAGIDTPETRRGSKYKNDVIRCDISGEDMVAFGKRSTLHIQEYLTNREEIKITHLGLDFFGRSIVWIDGLNLSLVRNGYALAVAYDRLPIELTQLLLDAQKTAIANNAGLWGYMNLKCLDKGFKK